MSGVVPMSQPCRPAADGSRARISRTVPISPPDTASRRSLIVSITLNLACAYGRLGRRREPRSLQAPLVLGWHWARDSLGEDLAETKVRAVPPTPVGCRFVSNRPAVLRQRNHKDTTP